MNEADFAKCILGMAGTMSSFALANFESIAAIFAGLATGVFMLVSAYYKIKDRK